MLWEIQPLREFQEYTHYQEQIDLSDMDLPN
jgi:hypothetical protein